MAPRDLDYLINHRHTLLLTKRFPPSVFYQLIWSSCDPSSKRDTDVTKTKNNYSPLFISYRIRLQSAPKPPLRSPPPWCPHPQYRLSVHCMPAGAPTPNTAAHYVPNTFYRLYVCNLSLTFSLFRLFQFTFKLFFKH